MGAEKKIGIKTLEDLAGIINWEMSRRGIYPEKVVERTEESETRLPYRLDRVKGEIVFTRVHDRLIDRPETVSLKLNNVLRAVGTKGWMNK